MKYIHLSDIFGDLTEVVLLIDSFCKQMNDIKYRKEKRENPKEFTESEEIKRYIDSATEYVRKISR